MHEYWGGKENNDTSKNRECVFKSTAEEARTEPDVVKEATSSSSNPSAGELTIEGDGKRLPEVCTLAKARKHVPHRGSNFLAYVVDSRAKAKKKTVAHVSVVSEYRDVFPNDLPGILPEKQVEYRIERVLGTAPIAKARTG
ncbi:hypothetical protein OSB04_un001313 [Centaurea solstitialis]|uniref:Uncharacterized protein n=1 Tax=Centaurea solstitialis TaxID=347529 RepID=A0AA38W537_9ASTR|nr:hypothetical protein OSB04_un001313 [Centaurea solstitialis]